ncbi:NepR family anti-sigma factor [Microvirga antarctica]|uniref:NepR family anti-sigma factor n=1 Tax=Microvirga antarctica TaxID=2819233 RepID=UPI001B30B7F9|nr:NepR family anti-sigma factor [Microvirga antarctica]
MPGVFPPDPVPGTANAPSLSRTVQAQLGQRLRHFYESLALGETPVPDRFIEILNRLDNVEPGGKTS